MRKLAVVFVLFVTALLPTAGSVRADEKDDKIKALEKTVLDLKAEVAKLKGEVARVNGKEVFRKEYGIGEQKPTEVVDFTIEPGDIGSVVAEGKVEHGHPFIGASTPKGAGGPAPGEVKFPAPQLEKYSLIGRFNAGPWQLLGESFSQTWVNTDNGKLTLGYNDDEPFNKPKSVWKVTVVVTRSK